MSVTVQEIVISARAGLAAVTAETAGYFVLAAADQLAGATGRLGAVQLGEDGAVLIGGLTDGSPPELESDLRALLLLLLGQNSSRAPALKRAAHASPDRGMSRFANELEAALIPVNRAAARRALSRLHRDVLRAKTAGKLVVAAIPTSKVTARAPEATPAPSLPTAVLAPEVIAVPEPERPVTAPHPAPALGSAEAVPRVLTPEPAVAGPPFFVSQTPVVADAAVVAGPPVVADFGWIARGPDATPFLGSWGVVAPVVVSVRFPAVEPGEHDTERQPSVSFELPEDATPAPEETLTIATAEIVIAPLESVATLPVIATATPVIAAIAPDPLVNAESPIAVDSAGVVQDENDAFGVTVIQGREDTRGVPAQSGSLLPEPLGLEADPVAASEVPADAAPAEFEAAPVQGAPAEIEAVVAPSLDVTESADAGDPEVLEAAVEPAAAPIMVPAPSPEPVYAVYHPRKSDVADLVAGFAVAESRSLAELSRDLKRMAGVGTPCPPPVVLDSCPRKPSLVR